MCNTSLSQAAIAKILEPRKIAGFNRDGGNAHKNGLSARAAVAKRPSAACSRRLPRHNSAMHLLPPITLLAMPESAPQHGPARLMPWQISAIHSSSDDEISLSLQPGANARPDVLTLAAGAEHRLAQTWRSDDFQQLRMSVNPLKRNTSEDESGR